MDDSRLSGTCGAALAGLIMWVAASYGASNLPSRDRLGVELLLIIGAVMAGAIGGAASARHAERPQAVLYFVTTGAIVGAVCGGAYALVMGLLYVAAYGGAPVSLTDGLIVVLSFPVFVALGALTGLLPGIVCGAVLGLVASRSVSS